jgi:hypothetical protein
MLVALVFMLAGLGALICTVRLLPHRVVRPLCDSIDRASRRLEDRIDSLEHRHHERIAALERYQSSPP